MRKFLEFGKCEDFIEFMGELASVRCTRIKNSGAVDCFGKGKFWPARGAPLRNVEEMVPRENELLNTILVVGFNPSKKYESHLG